MRNSCSKYASSQVPPGMASLPRSFLLLGWATAVGFLLLVAYLTHFSVEAITLGR